MSKSSWRVVILLCALIGPRPAMADEVWLVNGDSMSGTAQAMEGGVLTFKPPYAEPVKLAWRQVAGLQIEHVVRITVRGLGPNVARVMPGPPGQLRLQSEVGTTLDIRLGDVMAIVPRPSGVIITGRGETGLLVSSGNSDVNNLHLTGEINWRTAEKRTSTDILVNRAQNQGLETIRNLTWTFRHAEFFTTRFYANGNVIVTNDRFRDIDLRTAPGLGVGYQFLEFGVTTLALEGGIGYVNENHTIEGDRRYWAARETVKYEHYLIPKRLQLFHQHDGYVGLSGAENSFVRTRTGLRVNLAGGLIMTGQLGLDYDERPVAGQSHTDRTFAITLGYQR